MHWFIKLRIVLAVLKVYPIWAAEWVRDIIRTFIICLLPRIFFTALITKKSDFIKNVMMRETRIPRINGGRMSVWDDDIDRTLIVTNKDYTFWFRYAYETGFLNDDRMSCASAINLRELQLFIPFNNMIIDFVGKNKNLTKIIVNSDNGKFYYGNAKLDNTKLVNFDTIRIE